MFSTTKGVSALAVAVAVARGLISYDAKVADYWPDFAQASKGLITVRQLLSHQAGLPAIDVPLTLHDLADRTKVSLRSRAAPRVVSGHPARLPRRHARLVRVRTDPPCGSPRAFPRTVLRPRDCRTARPGVLHWIAGLGGPRPGGVLAHVCLGRTAAAPQHGTATFCRGTGESVRPHRSNTLNPKGIGNLDAFNRDEVRTVEYPRPMALVPHGRWPKRTAASRQAVLSSALPRASWMPFQARRSTDQGVARQGAPCRHHLFPWLPQAFPKLTFGSSDKAFGTPGAGGSFGFADPDTGIGFAYAMNKAGFHLYNDPRELALRQALFHDIVGARSQI